MSLGPISRQRFGWHFADQPAGPDRTAQRRPVIVQGSRYPSVTAAARASGMSPTTLGDRIKLG